MSLAQEMRNIAIEYRRNENICFMDSVYSKIIDSAYHGDLHTELDISAYGDIVGEHIISKLTVDGFKVKKCNNLLTVKW